MDDTDPFLSVQSDVQQTLTTTRHLYSSYLRIRTLNPHPSSPSPELLQSRSELLSNISQLTADLSDLLESVRAVETDPYRFGLDVPEVQRRKQFVQDVAAEVQGMKGEVEDVSGTGGSGALPNPAAFDEDGDGDEDAYAAFEQQTQAQMFREQDEQLDDVFRSVGVLRGQAQDMGRELEEQAGMLDEVDTLADRVGGKLNTGVKKIGEVIKRNEDTYSSCCIGVLIVVLIILLILVIVI